VFVANYDSKPAPKNNRLWRGQATWQRLTEHTLFTSFGGVVGT
jgi:hypothetical protein